MSAQAWSSSVVLGVRHVRESAEYYRDVLGFALDPIDGVFQPTEDEPQGVYGIVKRNHVWIHFQIRRGDFTVPHRGTLDRDVYIYVDELNSIFAELNQNRAHIVQHPQIAGYGIREFVIEDLNGYRIAFGERLASGL